MTLDIAAIKARADKATEIQTAFEGYTVSEDGDVYSHHNWRGYGKRALDAKPNSHGYLRVKVKSNGRMKSTMVHKLVCLAFHGPKPTPYHQVRHLNGVKTDNRATNLAWGTASENAMDRKLHGTERAAENGRKSALTKIYIKNPFCFLGHDKRGQRSCPVCSAAKKRLYRIAKKGNNNAFL